jgi:hypothetical protein
MQVFVNISSGGCFYSKNYARQPTQVTSALRAPFLQRSQLLLRTRGTCHILLHSAEVRQSKRDQSLVAQPSCEPHPHFLGVGPSQ